MDNQLSLYNAIPAGGVFGTRTSERWPSEPSTMDTINAKVIWPHAGKWGIPTMDPCDFEPSMLADWHDPHGRKEAAETGGALHFFLDDYRFERVWKFPHKTLEDRVAPVGAAITPEFSVWESLPIVSQMWQVFRSRWMGAWWQYHGIKVIPCVIWGDPDTFDFAFEGLPEGGALALGTLGPGSNTQEAKELYRQGLEVLLERTKPTLLLTYGKLPVTCEWLNLPRVREYETFGQRRLSTLSELRKKQHLPQQEEEGLSWDVDQEPPLFAL